MNPTTKCPICGGDGATWTNVDEYRLKAEGMCLCSKCGFVTYPSIVENSEKMKEFYRKEYRPAPTVQNVFTGQRKLHYHAQFLSELFETWKKKKKTSPVIFEIGSAFGMFLRWMRDNFPKADVGGSELTLSFRRVAFHEYGLSLVEEFDDSKKYDLIASYKVLEHMPHPDRELRRYALALKDDGLLYISVPTWFHTMTNFGADGFSLDYYYDKNHVNVWTRTLFETLLKKCGLEITKVDYVMYDATYLCKRNDELMTADPAYEDTTEIIQKLAAIKAASVAFDDGNFGEAMRLFPRYPDAIVAHYEKNRAAWHEKGFEVIDKEIIAPVVAHSHDVYRVSMFAADICMRYEQFQKAMDHLDRAAKQKPNDPGVIIAVGHVYRELANRSKDPKEKLKAMLEARETARHLRQVSSQHSLEAITWIFADSSKIPMPNESSQ